MKDIFEEIEAVVMMVIVVALFLAIIFSNVYIYLYAPCNSWLMGVMPQREIPGRCLNNLK